MRLTCCSAAWLSAKGLDEESAGWLRRLGADGGERQAAERELHARLVRIALAEVRRRSARTPVTGPELDDVAHQAAGDAMMAILAKLGDFRGESRFTTWAYRFVFLEVSGKLGRHYWRNSPAALDAGQWERLPDRLGIDPARHAEATGILAEVRRVVDDELTAHQRRVFEAIVVDGTPLDALAAELGLRRNAIYKVIFDARRKIRRGGRSRALPRGRRSPVGLRPVQRGLRRAPPGGHRWLARRAARAVR